MAIVKKTTEESKNSAEHLRIQRDKERQLVKGKFIYHECPGGEIGFMFKKYKGDPLEKFILRDGEIYTLPLGVARNLNTNVAYDTYNFSSDDQGRPKCMPAGKVRRCSFQSLEFLDIEGLPNSIPSAIQNL